MLEDKNQLQKIQGFIQILRNITIVSEATVTTHWVFCEGKMIITNEKKGFYFLIVVGKWMGRKILKDKISLTAKCIRYWTLVSC